MMSAVEHISNSAPRPVSRDAQDKASASDQNNSFETMVKNDGAQKQNADGAKVEERQQKAQDKHDEQSTDSKDEKAQQDNNAVATMSSLMQQINDAKEKTVSDKDAATEKLMAAKLSSKEAKIDKKEEKISIKAGADDTRKDSEKPVSSGKLLSEAVESSDGVSKSGRGIRQSPADKVREALAMKFDGNTGAVDKTGVINKPLEVGDKIDLKAVTDKATQLSRITDVEVTQNKQVGDLKVLHIKLNPEDLGSVDARMRLTHNGLQIELRAERIDTARLLAADHHMLTKTIEKAGFNNDDGRLSISIVDRSGSIQSVQNSSAGQGANNQSFGGQEQSGQQFGAQTGQQGQGRQNSSAAQAGFDSALSGKPAIQVDEKQNAYRDPRRLVV